MRFLRCTYAECSLLTPRLWRTQFGVALVLLGAALIWLGTRGLDSLTVALQAGALGAVLGAANAAGREADRLALTTALTHPTTPLAIATGRWLAVIVPACGLSVACTAAVGGDVTAAVAGFGAAAAVGAAALSLALALGTGAVAILFLFMAVAGTIAPERLVDLAHPGIVRLAAASALELGPALWHYRDIAHGDLGALVHALAWAGLGVLLAGGLVAGSRSALHR
jgi:hypothetical protein